MNTFVILSILYRKFNKNFNKMAEEKKISFSFGKLKKPNLLSAPKKPEKESVTGGIQLIDCLEAQTIKIIG